MFIGFESRKRCTNAYSGHVEAAYCASHALSHPLPSWERVAARSARRGEGATPATSRAPHPNPLPLRVEDARKRADAAPEFGARESMRAGRGSAPSSSQSLSFN